LPVNAEYPKKIFEEISEFTNQKGKKANCVKSKQLLTLNIDFLRQV